MVPECRHIKTSGSKCDSPALRDRPYCYFHTRQRERAAERLKSPATPLSFSLSNLEDRSAIQHATTQVLIALADFQIDAKRAGLLLYGLQLAAGNAKDAAQIISRESVVELTRTEEGEDIAPEGATSQPQEEESLAAMLKREIREHLRKSDLAEGAGANKELGLEPTSQPVENRDLSQFCGGGGGSPLSIR